MMYPLNCNSIGKKNIKGIVKHLWCTPWKIELSLRVHCWLTEILEGVKSFVATEASGGTPFIQNQAHQNQCGRTDRQTLFQVCNIFNKRVTLIISYFKRVPICAAYDSLEIQYPFYLLPVRFEILFVPNYNIIINY